MVRAITMLERMQWLKTMGVDLQYVLDIGSFHGQFGDMIHEIWPHAHVISIEANPQHQSINPQQITACLSDQDNKWVEFYTPQPGIIATGASYYLENTHYYQDHIATAVQTVTIDTFYQQHSWHADWQTHGMVKMDTQGSELDILRGAGKFFAEQQPRFLLLEVGHQSYNKGAPSASDVVAYLCQQGYKWIDIWDQFRGAHNTLLQSDLLFERQS
jgi:FkbM family methyltransferase